MMRGQHLDKLVRELCAADLLAQARPVPALHLRDAWAQSHGVVAAVDGEVLIDGREVSMRIGLPQGFPGQLPKIFVLDTSVHGRIPHIFAHGHICFQEAEGVLLDRHRPIEVAREALSRALNTLRHGLNGDNRSDFIEELALYWPGAVEGVTFFHAGHQVQEVRRVPNPWTGTFAFVRDRAHAHEVLVPDPALRGPEITAMLDPTITKTWSRGLYIPLQGVPKPLDPFPLGPWTHAQIESFIRDSLTPTQERELERFVCSMKKQSTFVILRVPKPRGGEHLVGVRYENIRGAHPLARRPGNAEYVQFRIERRDPGYLLPRGGADDLRHKRVVLAGCGAVGGHLALELIRCGIGHLLLVDPDDLRPENAYRHVLGMPGGLLRPKKALQLAADIERRYPGAQVKGFPGTIEQAIDVGLFVPAEQDLLISATGDPNTDRALNERLLQAPSCPPTLFTWLEPLGIGGHAVTFPGPRQVARQQGCFDCLFTPNPLDPEPVLENHAAFAASGQVFTRELAGCGNAFTPYSSLDALRTAELAARLAVEVLQDRVPGGLLRSWKGSGEAFRAAGYRTSPRHELSAEVLERGCADLSMARCKVCGSA